MTASIFSSEIFNNWPHKNLPKGLQCVTNSSIINLIDYVVNNSWLQSNNFTLHCIQEICDLEFNRQIFVILNFGGQIYKNLDNNVNWKIIAILWFCLFTDDLKLKISQLVNHYLYGEKGHKKDISLRHQRFSEWKYTSRRIVENFKEYIFCWK